MSCDPDGDIEILLRATRVTQVPDSISSQISFGPLGPALHFPDDGVGDVELRTPPEGWSLCGNWRDSIVPLELKRKGGVPPVCTGVQAWDPLSLCIPCHQFSRNSGGFPCPPPPTRIKVCGECSPAELGMK